MNKYMSVCCNAAAKKEPLKAHKDWKSLSANDFEGLGKWYCGHCGKKTVVKVVKE